MTGSKGILSTYCLGPRLGYIVRLQDVGVLGCCLANNCFSKAVGALLAIHYSTYVCKGYKERGDPKDHVSRVFVTIDG